MTEAKYIWMDGEFVNWHDANVHVLSHTLHYGNGAIEGTKAYKTVDGRCAIFKLNEHTQRLINSSKMTLMNVPFTVEELNKAQVELLQKNELFEGAYIRPLVYLGYGVMGLYHKEAPVKVSCAAWEWGAYLGDDSIEKGISAMTSSWFRLAPNTIPTLAKAGGNYLSSQLIKMEALENGYDEGIALDVNGQVSEASAANLFIVKNGIIYTPSITSSALLGITRNSVIDLAKSLGYEVKEMPIPREMLYICDEMFFTGTAVEITPVGKLDGIEIGNGTNRPVTKALQKLFYDVVKGHHVFDEKWLTYVK